MILISWIAQETTTLAAGGDELEVEYQSIVLDGATSESYATEATATEHPVEEDADITDHLRPHLRRQAFDIVVSAHPGPSSPAWQDGWTIDGEEDSRPVRIRRILERLILWGIEVSIETGVQSFDSMLLLGFEEERTAESGDGLKGRLLTREFRRVSTEEVEAPAPRVERGRRRSDRGRQRGAESDSDESVSSGAGDRSTALGILQDLNPGGVFG